MEIEGTGGVRLILRKFCVLFTDKVLSGGWQRRILLYRLNVWLHKYGLSRVLHPESCDSEHQRRVFKFYVVTRVQKMQDRR